MRPFKWLQDQRGVTAVEFALISPVLIALIFGTFELGRFMFSNNAMEAAVAKAGRMWMIDPAISEGDVKQAYCERAFLTDCTRTRFTVTTQSIDGQTWREIEVVAPFESPVSGMLPFPEFMTRTEMVPIYVN